MFRLLYFLLYNNLNLQFVLTKKYELMGFVCMKLMTFHTIEIGRR